MKKGIKILSSIIAFGMLIMCLAGCSNSVKSNEKGAFDKQSEKVETIKIDDIEWNVEQGIIDSERYVLLNLKNNSKYDICGFNINFVEKDDASEENKEAVYKNIQNKLEVSDEEIEELKSLELSMKSEVSNLIKSGESLKNIYCYYYDGFFKVDDIDFYNLVKPDTATIKYIKEGNIFTVYYDFIAEKYSSEQDITPAVNWSTFEIGNKIPKPESKVVEKSTDEEDMFHFKAYGFTIEKFNEYVKKCKEIGYTLDSASHEGFYSADSAENYNIYMNFDKESYSLDLTVKKIES